ncbi:MAG: aminotransferase class I/II-fold pyridoxal phosphate-dependent enzyme [Phycisphaerales bacterium]|nr:aminotransferase class I/II-fold pyridoxal phosphate-dependent enzyme [Phycisphaerales bacterium]
MSAIGSKSPAVGSQRVTVPAERTREIRYAVRDILLIADEVARSGREMLYLNIGDPNLYGFAPPAHMIEAVERAMRDNRNGYAPSSGIPEAVAAVRRSAEAAGIRDVQHVYITSGCSEAIELALAALVNPGENVLTPSPGYPLYTAVLAKLGAQRRDYFLDEEDGWQPNVEDIAARIDDRTRALVLINPNNPTGAVCTRRRIEQIVELALRHDLVIISDEIYDKLLFDGGTHVSTASVAAGAKVITFNGLSKSYVVPGFRIGWGIVSGPAAALGDYCEAIRKMERARISANHPEQYAIRPALEGPQDHIREMMERLTRRRDVLMSGLAAIPGVSCVTPAGAFYAFPRLHGDEPDERFVTRLIRETGAVVVPGSGFGQRPGTRHFRVVFLPDERTIQGACDAIRRTLERGEPAG